MNLFERLLVTLYISIECLKVKQFLTVQPWDCLRKNYVVKSVDTIFDDTFYHEPISVCNHHESHTQ